MFRHDIKLSAGHTNIHTQGKQFCWWEANANACVYSNAVTWKINLCFHIITNPAKMLRKRRTFCIRTRSIHKAMKVIQKIMQSLYLFQPTNAHTHTHTHTHTFVHILQKYLFTQYIHLHVSTFLCHHQGVLHSCLAKLHEFLKLNCSITIP
jgi:hypothetical protein